MKSRDLLATVNSASAAASRSWIAFLGTMAYLAVTLSGITHADLLLNNDTTLPFVNVKVPLATFFVMAPVAFVLAHFGLLLQHVMLSRKLRAFEARLNKEQPSRPNRWRERAKKGSLVRLLTAIRGPNDIMKKDPCSAPGLDGPQPAPRSQAKAPRRRTPAMGARAATLCQHRDGDGAEGRDRPAAPSR